LAFTSFEPNDIQIADMAASAKMTLKKTVKGSCTTIRPNSAPSGTPASRDTASSDSAVPTSAISPTRSLFVNNRSAMNTARMVPVSMSSGRM